MDERRLRLRAWSNRLTLIFGQDAAVAAWVAAHAPHCDSGFREFVAVGVEDGGELIAGWVFSEYHGYTISCSMASTTSRWASRRTLRALFAYPFVQLDCKRMTAITGKSMTHVRQFLDRLGFTQEGVLRHGFSDDDAVIYGMLRDECRWVKEIHGTTVRERLAQPAACT